MTTPHEPTPPTPRPDPSGWLGFERLQKDPEFQPSEWEIRTADWRGPLRGVRSICLTRLEKAQTLAVEQGETEGTYFVHEPQNAEDGEWVNLTDPQVDRCHCADFVWRGEETGSPCKHFLAALIADGNEHILGVIGEQTARARLAAAIRKPVVDDRPAPTE